MFYPKVGEELQKLRKNKQPRHKWSGISHQPIAQYFQQNDRTFSASASEVNLYITIEHRNFTLKKTKGGKSKVKRFI